MSSLKSEKNKWLSNKRKKSCLKALALASPSTFKRKINVSIIFGVLLVNFMDIEKIQLIVSRKKHFFDLNFKNEKLCKFFPVSDKITSHNCGPRKDVEDLAQFINAGGSLKLYFEKRVGYLCSISSKML